MAHQLEEEFQEFNHNNHEEEKKGSEEEYKNNNPQNLSFGDVEESPADLSFGNNNGPGRVFRQEENRP